MPIEIDCPCTYGPYSPKTIAGIKYCGDCKGGKIIFYTQEEFDKAVQAEREACAELCLAHEGKNLEETYHEALEDCAEAIRKRGE